MSVSQGWCFLTYFVIMQRHYFTVILRMMAKGVKRPQAFFEIAAAHLGGPRPFANLICDMSMN
jgi:hypothetical protein